MSVVSWCLCWYQTFLDTNSVKEWSLGVHRTTTTRTQILRNARYFRTGLHNPWNGPEIGSSNKLGHWWRARRVSRLIGASVRIHTENVTLMMRRCGDLRTNRWCVSLRLVGTAVTCCLERISEYVPSMIDRSVHVPVVFNFYYYSDSVPRARMIEKTPGAK